MNRIGLKAEIINTYLSGSSTDYLAAFGLAGAAKLFSYLYAGSASVAAPKLGRARKYRKRKVRFSKRKISEELGISVRMYSLYPFFEELNYFEQINNLNIR